MKWAKKHPLKTQSCCAWLQKAGGGTSRDTRSRLCTCNGCKMQLTERTQTAWDMSPCHSSSRSFGSALALKGLSWIFKLLFLFFFFFFLSNRSWKSDSKSSYFFSPFLHGHLSQSFGPVTAQWHSAHFFPLFSVTCCCSSFNSSAITPWQIWKRWLCSVPHWWISQGSCSPLTYWAVTEVLQLKIFPQS